MAGRNYIFVSDLHLSEGFLNDRKCYHVNEDFFYDDAFARFLEHLEDKRKAERYKKPWRLVINGDFVDFLQVTTAPRPDDSRAVADFRKFVRETTGKDYEDDLMEIDDKEGRLGLGFDAPKSVWKLARVVAGHPRFFEALTGFLAAGNELVIIKGNHDAEFTYAEVRDFFREVIDDFAAGVRPGGRAVSGKGSGRRKRARAGRVSKRVYFSRWFYCEDGLFYVEHGGQYDAYNRYVFFLDPTMYEADGKLPTIRFPFGSFFVRYFFNGLEERVPFADNVRPRSKVFMWIFLNELTYGLSKVGAFVNSLREIAKKKLFTHFDQLSFREWLRAKKSIFARCLYYLDVYGLIKLIWKPDPDEYDRYKKRNFWFMSEVEGTNGFISENGAAVGKAGPSISALFKIYNRSFREDVGAPATEERTAELLEGMTSAANEEKAVRRRKLKYDDETVNEIVSTFSAAAQGKPHVAAAVIKCCLCVLAVAVILLSLDIPFGLAFVEPYLVSLGLITIPAAALAVYVFRRLPDELASRYLGMEPEHYLNEAAAGVARILSVPYVILGHTHVAYVRPIGSDGEKEAKDVKQWEVNTGSWTPVYAEKMMLRQAGDEFPFIQITTEGKGEAELKLLHWNDELGEPQTIRYTGEC
jgi:UDP-2,3-diacylglucosamine pyrophosphatase LpxH